MNQSAKWVTFSMLAAAGLLALACGGGETSGGAAAPTASTSAPAASESTSAAASASAPAAAATTPPAPANPPLVVAAMKLTIPSSKPVELDADGSVKVDGKTTAKFTGADLVDADGKTLVTVMADGEVNVAGGKHAKFNGQDELEIGGGKIHVGDDGVVSLVAPDGKPDKISGKAKFVGFKPAARRAATVLFAAMVTRTVTMSSPTAATSGPAAKPKK